jgi:hypothetical protein
MAELPSCIPQGVSLTLVSIVQTPYEEAPMCSPALCSTCGKTTWRGCGMHVDMVMAGVPQTQRCTCNEAPGNAPAASFFRTPGR